jgi:hypothetical protein
MLRGIIAKESGKSSLVAITGAEQQQAAEAAENTAFVKQDDGSELCVVSVSSVVQLPI